MAESAWAPSLTKAVPAVRNVPRHSLVIRVTHWLTVLWVGALLLSGIEILISHPRFYWGEAGNSSTQALFRLPIPASRATVPTGYGYVLPDQNGWSRSLHFEAAWGLVLTGCWYLISGLVTGHFRKNLLPARWSWSEVSATIASHVRLRKPVDAEYNVVQRLAYLGAVFVLFPAMIWTGLAMSPAVVSALPFVVTVLGGQQSARTMHFFCTLGLVLFVLVHVGMVVLAGFRNRMGAMITGGK